MGLCHWPAQAVSEWRFPNHIEPDDKEGSMRRSVLAETDDQQLISLAVAGNREAFGRLYERHQPRVFRHAYFLTGDFVLAEDLTAQTFLNAFQAIPRYEPRGVPFVSAYLRRLVLTSPTAPARLWHSQQLTPNTCHLHPHPVY